MFSYCYITDFLDGYITRKFNIKSVVGTILASIGDKFLIIFTTLALILDTGSKIIPYSIATLILGRDIPLDLIGGIIRFTSMKKVYDSVKWNSYRNLTKYPIVEVMSTKISKGNTFLQMIYLGYGSLFLLLNQNKYKSGNSLVQSIYKQKDILDIWFKWLGHTVRAITALSDISYVLSKKGVTILPVLR